MSNSSVSDIELLEYLSDWDDDENDEVADNRNHTYQERINYMEKYENYELA